MMEYKNQDFTENLLKINLSQAVLLFILCVYPCIHIFFSNQLFCLAEDLFGASTYFQRVSSAAIGFHWVPISLYRLDFFKNIKKSFVSFYTFGVLPQVKNISVLCNFLCNTPQ